MDRDRTYQLLVWMENIISEQQAVISELFKLATPKRRAVIADDIPALQQVVAQEEKMLARLQELEQMRLRVVSELDTDSSNSQQPMGAEEIMVIAREHEPELAARLKRALDELTRGYAQLVEANQQNAVLIQDALNYIDNVIMVISGSNEGVVYSPQGEMGETVMRRYLNKKA